MLGHLYPAGSKFFVHLPDRIFSSLSSPDFSAIGSRDFLITTISICLVASLESLLSASAIDQIDPLMRKTDLNRDLLALGAATTLSSVMGGLPMIAEVVRSRANVDNGARGPLANLSHSLFLLIAVLCLPNILNLIPLSALSALLVVTGYRLASPRHFRDVAKTGYDQLLLFVVTLVGVLATDLLIGIAIGVMLKVVLHVFRQVSLRDLYSCRVTRVTGDDGKVTLRVYSAVIFTNLPKFTRELAMVERGAHLVIDLQRSPFIDHTAMRRLADIKRERVAQGGYVEIIESEYHSAARDHALAARRLRV
jgi:MFS superfamily sulfate permease-like transporter